ncbi:exported hypothetical protein [Verrucomicrobia bacterium]|nr:exported hypothetical protein [Verrucomicrobiota bacterium]
MKITCLIRRILLTRGVLLAFTLVLGGLRANSEGTSTVTAKGRTIDAVTTFEGTATHYTRRGKDKFSVGYYVKDGAILKEKSLLADKDGPVSNLDLDIVAKGEGFDSVIATGKGTVLRLSGTISASDNGDGKSASDFSGLGVQIVASDYAKVEVHSMKIDTQGFLRAALISDDHAQILVEDSTITTMGANPLTHAWKGYVNSANQNIMLSPPWVLGIQGGVRAANMIGNKSTLTVINSTVTSGGWAVLSTDEGNSPVMNVMDTTLQILPGSQGGMSSGKYAYSSKYGSGYGTYLTGNAHQYFYGVTFNGLTYAGIYTGGEGTYTSSNGKIGLKDAEGQVIDIVAGKGKPTTINSVFGFMSHGQGTVNVLDGTVVNSEEAIFLVKAGGVSFVADSAVLSSASGTLLQMIDNDDRTVGGTRDGFKTEFNEAPGWPSENGNVTKAGTATVGQQGGMPGGQPAPGGPDGPAPDGRPSGGPPDGPGGPLPGGVGGPPDGFGGPGGPGAPGGRGGSSVVKLALFNGNYKGNVFNGSGYYTQSGKALEVSIGKEATLSGAISLTETRHVDEFGKQNTHFTINEYFYLGHVANRNYRNGSSTISVSLKDGGLWKVTGESVISKLVVEDGTVEGANGAKVVMKIDGKEEPIKQGETYSGNIVIALAK